MPEKEEQRRLAAVIQQWNSNRLDLFEISRPDESLEFYGVMRFYFEDPVEGNVATKCVRVSSSFSTREVVEVLSEKFRPDMKMLSSSHFLYEVQSSGERRLDLNEKPLVVQLNWNSDNREGRFVLKKGNETSEANCHEKKEKGSMIQNFKRTLSRKEKKQKNKTKSPEEEKGSVEKLQNQSIFGVSSQKHPNDKKQERRQSDPGVIHSGNIQRNCSNQHALPVEIQVSQGSEDAFLSAVINYTNSSTVHFKLSPAYALYAAARSALQHSHSKERTPRVTAMTNKMVTMTEKVIQKQQAIAGALAFWMANTSEFLNFIKQDKELGALTQQAQVDLSHLVHKDYKYLIQCLQNELRKHLPTFLVDPEQHGPLPAGIEMVLNTLMNAMSLVRRCRVNPALTIQLFSQLFHFISAWLFNQLMGPEACSRGLRSHYWGATLLQRLTAIEAWAGRQGLELAADCHLGHIVQATMLLTMNKYSVKDAKDIQNTCFKLNSLQLKTLLTSYLYATNEPHIPPGLIDTVVAAAETLTDNLAQSEGRGIQREESLDLHLPFLLPEGGYSCGTMSGIPPGFREFMEPICCKGLCTLTPQSNCNGNWTLLVSETSSAEITRLAPHREPEMMTITLRKPLNSGMGVSIVAARGSGQEHLGIYVKSIVKGGPAEMDGRLTAGDQLLTVDGRSLVGLNQERAAGIMMQTSPVVTLQVAKHAACYHGLEALLSDPGSVPKAGLQADTVPRPPKPNGVNTQVRYKSTDPSQSEQWGNHHGTSRRKREQMMQRDRQLYRSNPNMACDTVPEEGEAPADRVVGKSLKVAVSTLNLYNDIFQVPYSRDYVTLPSPRYQNKKSPECEQSQVVKVPQSSFNGQSSNRRTSMRQALSQENLCVDSGVPLLDKQHHLRRQDSPSSSSFPLRQSVSSNDILSDCDPTKPQHGPTSGANMWRTPPSQAPAVQPTRIDIPIARAAGARSKPPLTTFQHTPLPAVKVGRNLKGNGGMSQSLQKQSAQVQASPIYECPIPPAITRKEPTAKFQMTISPTKHVSFRTFPAQQQEPQQRPDPKWQTDLQYFTMSKALPDGCGPSPDPWRRDAQEKLQKQQRLRALDLLEQETQELRAKGTRTQEENDRLRKLSLEWQFQKRLQEFQQNGGDDEEEEDEDRDMMVTLQQLDNRVQDQGHNKGQQTPKTELEDQMKAASGPAPRRLDCDHHMMSPQQYQGDKLKNGSPENLTFKQRQHLFSPVSSSQEKVKSL